MSFFCNVCGVRTAGGHFLYRRIEKTQKKGLVVCQDCEKHAKRCSMCRIPIHPLVSRDDLCLTCAREVPNCAACDKLISGRAVYNRTNEMHYCEHCFEFLPHCTACGGAVGQHGHKLADGRFICGQCHETAVYEFATANNLYRRVVAMMSYNLSMRLKSYPALILVDRNQMLQLLKQVSMQKTDKPEQVFGMFVQRHQQREIYIQSGLPQILTIEVMAHEYAHAWQAEYCPWLQDALTIEGFAEWAAYRVLTLLAASKKAALMEERADIYGQGLRRMLALEHEGGTAAVFHACQ